MEQGAGSTGAGSTGAGSFRLALCRIKAVLNEWESIEQTVYTASPPVWSREEGAAGSREHGALEQGASS